MIAISYRREDSSPVTGRLYDRLLAEFGKGNVFMDFDSIPYGVDFREKIKQTLEGAQVVIAVIGPAWLGSRGRGKRRINDPTDFVRIEISHALLRGIPVIPVLLDNTPMPKVESLPEELQGLAYRNALVLDTGLDFHHHANRLIAGIRDLIKVPAPPPPAEPATLKPGPGIPNPKTKEEPADGTRNTKRMLIGAIVLLGLVTVLALWSLISSLSKSNNSTVTSTAATQATQDVLPATTPPESVGTIFQADSPSPAIVAAATTTPVPTATPKPTATLTPTPTATPTPTLTPTPTATPTPTPRPTPAPTPSAMPVPATTLFSPTPFAPPARTPTTEIITPEEAQVLAHSFYGAIERKDIDSLVSLCDESVEYRTDEYRGKAAVRDDYSRYFKRWPMASYTIGDIRIQRSTSPDKMVLVFDIHFKLRNPAGKKRSASGRATETWVVVRTGNVPKITHLNEQIH